MATAGTSGLAVAEEGNAWHPRPLALPATSDQQPTWRPPELTAGLPSTIIIAAPPQASESPTITRKRSVSSQASGQPAEPELRQPLPPSDRVSSSARTSELARNAVDQLRQAHWASKRGASHSAHQAATQTLRVIATLRDAQHGGNQHSEQLTQAMTAIQESTDFSGRYGPVDTSALTRLIDVHQTPVLHHVDTRSLTSIRAVEAYLGFAKEKLVLATQGGPLAADAILILARLESAQSKASRVYEAIAGHSRMHASELALMYRRAAVEIAPDSPQAAADLGRTLLTRSLPVDAKQYLQQSVAQSPTRQSVEDLLRAASLAGDFVVVDQCEKALVARRLPSELPVTFLPPDQFARTHQRSSGELQGSIARQSSPSAHVASRPADAQAASKGRASHRRLTPSTDSRIVDPTMPSPAHNPNQSRGLIW